MGCKRICIVDIGIRKCCMECEKHEECPDYVKENEDENCKR